jgi:hypothetical protein
MSKTLIQGLAQSLFNKTDDELAGLFGETEDAPIDESKAIEFFKNQLAEKVRSVTENQLGRGKKEAHTNWEKAIKARAQAREVQLSEDLKGEALIDALLESMTPQGGNVEELTPEQLKKHKAFQSILEESITPFKAKLTEYETALETERKSNLVRLNQEAVINQGFEVLENANWKKGETPEEQAKRKKTMTDLFQLYTNGFTKVKVENGNVFLLNDAGEIDKDELHNVKDFKKWVLELNSFGTHAFDPGKGSSGASSGQQKPSGSDYKVVDGVSLSEALNGVSNPAEKAKIIRAYSDQLKK